MLAHPITAKHHPSIYLRRHLRCCIHCSASSEQFGTGQNIELTLIIIAVPIKRVDAPALHIALVFLWRAEIERESWYKGEVPGQWRRIIGGRGMATMVFLPAAKHVGQLIIILPRLIFEIQAVSGQIDKATCVIEFTDWKYEVRLDL